MKRTPKKWIDYTDWTVEQHEAYLRTEAVFQPFYAKYEPESVETFIIAYAKSKHRKFEHEVFYKEQYEAYEIQFLKIADGYIDQILQKKLFDLQCQWRACLIELPLVDIVADFEYWEHHIRACPFITPITEAEIDLCLRFLKEDIDLTQDPSEEYAWQDYDKFKNQLYVDDHGGEPDAQVFYTHQCASLPDLYIFFDTHQGRTSLMDLPNIRGEAEEDYIKKGKKIYNAERNALYNATHTPKPVELDEQGQPKVWLPTLYSFSAEFDTFVETLEDEHTKELYKHYNHFNNHGTNRYSNDLEENLNFLQSFDEEIPIGGHSNWQIAIALATYTFKQQKAAEMLPYAYDSYLLEFDDADNADTIMAYRIAHCQFDEENEHYQDLKEAKKKFLDGREALTGKRDFNYV
jgi:hypothetical protein